MVIANSSENSDPSWTPFKITRSVDEETGMEHDFNLLNDNKNSILGDISILIGEKEYTLDRAILASKSTYFKDLMLSQSENSISILNEMNNTPGDTSLVHDILDIIYGNKDANRVMNENNFVKLLNYMKIFKIEIDLPIFDDFIQHTISSKVQLSAIMFELLNLVLKNSVDFSYLVSTASKYLSDRILHVYKEKEFLNLSAEELLSILLHQNGFARSGYKLINPLERRLVGHMCAQWICHEYRTRITKLKDLVNATKYRHYLLPYCYLDVNTLLESLPMNHSSEPDVSLVEKYFNELLVSHGEADFGTPPELTDLLNSMKVREHVLNPTDQTVQWVSFLDKEIFSDVAIIVQGTTFKLHRIKLSSVSGYFYDLFTNPAASLAFEVDKSDDDLKICTHELDQINPETFQIIVQYIYRQEIEVTSKNHLINLLKASKFLKMYELFEKCSSKLLELPDSDWSADIVEIFQYICENGKYSRLHDKIAETFVDLWPKFVESTQFLNISLGTLTEIFALPSLIIDSTDQMLDLCSKWICHDTQNRYKYTIEVAKAINRNFTMNIKQLEPEILQNPIDFSPQYVKRQLIEILSSTALVPAKITTVREDEQKPCFLALNKNRSLSVLDSNFDEIFRLSEVNEKNHFLSSATVIDNQLFVLFLNHTFEFYFQLYDISSKKMIRLASDARMNLVKKFAILSCNDEVYFCNDEIILKYSVELNRWVSLLKDCEDCDKLYTSDGKKLYKISPKRNEETTEWENTTSYYDFEQNGWIALPNIPIKNESIARGKVNIIKGELSVLFKSTTFSFSWVTQTWTSIFNCCENFEEFTADGQNILYVSNENEVYLYSPVQNKWASKRKLDFSGRVISVHKIDKE